MLRNNDTKQLFVPRPSGGIFLDGPAFGTAVGQLISSAQGVDLNHILNPVEKFWPAAGEKKLDLWFTWQ